MITFERYVWAGMVSTSATNDNKSTSNSRRRGRDVPLEPVRKNLARVCLLSRLSSDVATASFAGETCPVCLESLDDGARDGVALRCGHAFHAGCPPGSAKVSNYEPGQ